MNRYTIYCTPEQTKKALELGAPLQVMTCKSESGIKAIKIVANGMLKNKYTLLDNFQQSGDYWCKLITKPTSEQMIGWLEEQGILIDIHFYCISWDIGVRTKTGYIVVQKMAIDSRKEATLAAIDKALDYLTK